MMSDIENDDIVVDSLNNEGYNMRKDISNYAATGMADSKPFKIIWSDSFGL